MENRTLKDDLLNGADEIAAFTGFPVRRVYYLAERRALPIFWIGTRLAARKTELCEALSAKPKFNDVSHS
jgi:hypothetical protein